MKKAKGDEEDLKEYARGQVVRIAVLFEGDPDEVFFSFIPPGQSRAVVDEGFDQPGSKIRRLREALYVYFVDTAGFKEGTVECHFWGTGKYQASIFPKFKIGYAPPQLL